MKVLLLTGYDDNMTHVGDCTSRVMGQYASKHGIDFLRIRQYSKHTHPSWQKALHVGRQLSSGYDRVIWLDADTLITNSEISPFEIESIAPIEVSKDWGLDAMEPHHFNMGNFFANRDPNELWAHIWNRYLPQKEEEWGNKELWEQSALQGLYQTLRTPEDIFSICPTRRFNAVHAALAPSAPDPWQEGDWLCHLTGEEITTEKRLKVMGDLLNIIQ
jgi:hypothetical protein